MRYTDAVDAVAADLAADDPGAARAALHLALLSWREATRPGPEWDRFGLHILAVSESLIGFPDHVVLCDPPADPDAQAQVARVVEALAAYLQRAADDTTTTTTDLTARLTYDGAALALRAAVGTLP